MRSQTFLSMFRVLEGLLEKKYAGRGRTSSSIVMDYIGDAESEPVRAQLNLCRELRNLLTHNVDRDGNPVAEPSKAMLDTLYEIIEYVESPKPALLYATRGECVLRAHRNDRAVEVMRRMDKHGFSHVPVIEKEALVGVFGMRSVFGYVLKHGGVGQDTRIGEFGSLLTMNREGSERYRIFDAGASYHQVREAFERAVRATAVWRRCSSPKTATRTSRFLACSRPGMCSAKRTKHWRNRFMDDNLALLRQFQLERGKSSADAAFAEEFRNYQQVKNVYMGAIREIRARLETLDTEFEYRHKHNPIHHIQSRIKTLPSIMKKLDDMDSP